MRRGAGRQQCRRQHGHVRGRCRASGGRTGKWRRAVRQRCLGGAQPDDEASHRGIDFIVFNRTGRTITAIAIRPDEGALDPGVPDNPWGENILVQREVPAGQRSATHYEPDIELCTWEVRATFEDGQTRAYPTVNLCETIRVDLR